MKIAKYLVTEFAIPDLSNGSWTQMIYSFVSEFRTCALDYIICAPGTDGPIAINKITAKELKKPERLNNYLKNRRFSNYINEFEKLITNYDHVVLCFVDNVKLTEAFVKYIKANRLRHKVTIVFYCHTFSYYFPDHQFRKFSGNIDELILLGKSSYQYHKDNYGEMTCEVSILPNPINRKMFDVILGNDKGKNKSAFGLEGKTVYLWLSHDRPKKGLSMVLNAWMDFAPRHPDAVLLIVGAKRDIQHPQIKFIGLVSSDKVNQYYALADVFIFSTLCQEGFGLSLSQAMCCGIYSIASDYGGVKDFFRPVIDGLLIPDPHNVGTWINSLDTAYQHLSNGWVHTDPGGQIMTYDDWYTAFNKIFLKWENRVQQMHKL